MKKVILLLAMSSLLSTLLFAQSSPEGMNYQAVARNSKGEILANQPIALKVMLFSMQSNGKQVYYNEVHDVVTSPTGVFSLVVGKGTKESGVYENIPWALENVWMEVSIKSKGQSDFAVISNSRLLAVPYAYHALTAEKITGENVASAGNPSQSWLLFGNRESNPNEDKLGTTDSVDLVMVTNNLERLRIYANGDIFIRRSLRIGANLTVDSSAYLNRLGGATINYGPFTVDRQSPTLLSGKLTVDKETDLNSSLNVDGITDLNSKLNVNNNSASWLSGTLRVDGVTDLNNALNVNNVSPTLLTGTLRVDKDASFYEKIKILSDHQTDTSGAPPSGALQVGGGAYVAKNLYIGGIAKFGGPAAFGGAVTITDGSESFSTSTGALMIPYGGVGIGKRLNVGGGVLFESTLGVAGITSLNNATQSTATNNGALILAGGAGIGKNVNIGGSLTSAGITTLNSTLNVNASSSYIANFVNSTNANGISIQVAAPTPANANNFVTFRNSGGGVVGRIEGETSTELVNNDDYKVEKKSLDLAVTMATIDVVTGGIGVIMAGVDLVGAASSSTACAGLGVCVTAPVPSLIVAAGINLATAIADEISVAIGLDDAITQRNYFVSTAASNVGVTYQSGSGDYAEWLPKANPSEKFKPGYIVGMKNGRISLNSAGADKLFVISTKPIVLGNMPDEGMEAGYEKVAFMGQVPVHVVGKVNAGDYILPSGFNNGFAKAVAPDKMKADDYARIVGMAWSSSASEGANMVNVAIGLNTGDISKVVAEQSKEISELKGQISEINSLLAKLASGAKETGITKADNVVKAPPVFNPNGKDQHPVDFIKQDAGTVVYFEITTEQTTTMLEMAQKLFVEKGGDINTHPFWKKINTDPGYKEVIMNEIKKTFRNGMHTHQEINSKSSLQSKH
jgi:hypothetical protein